MKKHIWKIILIGAVILMGSAFAFAQFATQKANEGVVTKAHIKGNPEAGVTLVEYADFQCPACAQFYPVVTSIVEQYGDKMAFEYKHFPLVSVHPFALPAAKAAEAAGQQGKFFEMYDKLFTNQNAWSKSATPQVFFTQYAEELGLDMSLFKTHLRASVLDDHIKGQFNEARDLGLTGTPSFYLNGQRMEFKTMQEFIGAIESALGVTSSSSPQQQEVEFGLPPELEVI